MDPAAIPLRDLHLPDPVGWWPPGPGWWLVMWLALFAIAWFTHLYVVRRRQGSARRYALRQLDGYLQAYSEHGNAVTFGRQVSELVRRTMLAYAPRHEVAGLTGDAWLAWLDRDLDAPRFQTDAGRKLLEMPYRRPDENVAAMELIDVVAAVRQRLATPVGGRP